jgi:hypothetical protein
VLLQGLYEDRQVMSLRVVKKVVKALLKVKVLKARSPPPPTNPPAPCSPYGDCGGRGRVDLRVVAWHC